jgi:hypothetical protein
MRRKQSGAYCFGDDTVLSERVESEVTESEVTIKK